ncbi:MAG: hypothetical protein DCC49_08835 [Acidobacteria bacterium]|nr:MAG: hypothetical protein DCC49_08835 [Acidobacteriota bacterium]
MELKEAIGTRRSYRFLLPHKDVELWKIQKMLEAARLASFWGNVQALKAVVVHRATATDEVVNSLFAPVLGYQIERAPVTIVWYLDWEMLDEQGSRLKELVEARAMGLDREKADAHLDNILIPFFERIIPGMKHNHPLTAMDCGQGIAQATLVAIDEGLGTCCLGTANGDAIKKNLELPESAEILVLMTVGYPAETREAGGQRPRVEFERTFFLNSHDNPFPRDEAIVEELKEEKMIQAPAPLPWREGELKYLQKALDLPDF